MRSHVYVGLMALSAVAPKLPEPLQSGMIDPSIVATSGLGVFTVIAIALLVAVFVVTHDVLGVITAVTTSPFVREVVVKVSPPKYLFTPFTFHTYVGSDGPPLIGVALKVALAP